MSDLDKHRVEQEAHARGTDQSGGRYAETLNKYLGAATYQVRPAPVPIPEPQPATPAGLVLVGVDDTATSHAAVDHAATEAALRGWQLRMVHVQHPGRPGGPPQDAGARLLDLLAERVHQASPAVPVTTGLAVGLVAASLLTEARQADLLVVGHRHGRAGAALGLSVADRLAGLHPGTVLVVRVPGWSPGVGLGNRPIVVGVPQPGQSTPAVRFALEEARLRGCELVVLRAARGLPPSGHLETIEGVTVHHRTTDADPAEALTDFSHRASAVVVGRRGSGAYRLAMLGSVSRAVLERAACPVFLV